MKLSIVGGVMLVGSLVVACSGEAGPGPGPGPDPGEAVVDEAELRTPSFNGTYAPATSDDDFFASPVRIERVGTKLFLRADDFKLELLKTKSGAFVFTTGDVDGECDNPGCSFVTKVSGVVFLRKVGAQRVPSVKLTVREDHPHPEFDGDLEGETTTTLRWAKKR